MNSLPYGRQWVEDDDIEAVADALRSDWLTTGPLVDNFERAIADFVGVEHAVAVSSGTAALHASMFALDIGPGDEVIVPAMTFAATANCVVYQGGTPVFVDVNPRTLLIDPKSIEAKLTSKTKAVIAVDYAGQPCEYEALRAITRQHHIALVADACHSLGAIYLERPVGSLADLTTFSFHPVKHITTGEGGMIATSNATLNDRLRIFRNHGITTDHRQRAEKGSWFYEMTELGFNYRISDFQCALGQSQLKKLPQWIKRRQEIAGRYDCVLQHCPWVEPLKCLPDRSHAYHLYVVRVKPSNERTRETVFASLRTQGIGTNVHYIPPHLHPFYRREFGTKEGLCPAAEAAYKEILSLPIFPRMSEDDVKTVCDALSRHAC